MENSAKETFSNFYKHQLANIFFIFYYLLYKLAEGVAMGSGPGPTLANIFLCHCEKKDGWIIVQSTFKTIKLPVITNTLKHLLIENQMVVMYLRPMKVI